MTRQPHLLALGIQAIQTVADADRGIARYVLEHARAVDRLAPGLVDQFIISSQASLPKRVSLEAFGDRIRLSRDIENRGMAAPATYHVMSPFEGDRTHQELWPPVFRRPNAKLVVTVYDLIPLVFPEVYLAQNDRRATYLARTGLIRAADAILAISETTKRDVVRLLAIPEARVHVIGAGVGPEFTRSRERGRSLVDAQAALPDLRSGFLLYVGGFEFRKNVDGALRAYAALPPAVRQEHQLLLVARGSDIERQALRALARSLGCGSEEVVVTGHVSDAVLRSLYGSTDLFIFPSRYEGFGLPIVEAAECGASVAVADNSSMREIVSEPLARFAVDEPGGLTELLARFFADPSFRRLLARASADLRGQHTWRAVAERTRCVYDALEMDLERSARTRRSASGR